MKRFNCAAALAVLILFPAGAAFAQDKMHNPTPMQSDAMRRGKMMGDKTVYVCAKCKMYYTPMQAKRMGYKDPMGHKLMKKMQPPMGYKMGTMMKSKMGGMMDHKMGKPKVRGKM